MPFLYRMERLYQEEKETSSGQFQISRNAHIADN